MLKTIYIAGGCFWGVEAYYSRLKGIVKTRVGYAQGTLDNPSYREVCSGNTGHTETTELVYDDTVISLEKIIEHLMRFIDPTALNRQGNDIGTQYRSGIYSLSDEDKAIVSQELKKYQTQYRKPIVVENQRLTSFWQAEPYHQMYLEVNPQGYCHVNMNLIKKEELKDDDTH